MATAGGGTGAAAAADNPFASLPAPQLEQMQASLEARLAALVGAVPPAPAPPTKKRRLLGAEGGAGGEAAPEPVPVPDATDTHHDYLLKELQWLAADFAAERRRHAARRRQLAAALAQRFRSREERRLRQLARAEGARRRLAARLGRDLVQRRWWGQLDRVLALRQRQSLERARAAAMNRQLVRLVQLTEQYTRALTAEATGTGADGDDDNAHLSIEEALARGRALATRRSKLRVTNYAQLQRERRDREDEYLYGHSTASESGDAETEDDSDNDSYEPPSEAWTDDESTLEQAEREERALRRQQQRRHRRGDDENDGDDQASTASFHADPVELQLLHQEASMPLELVLERLQQQAEEPESGSPGQEQPGPVDDSRPDEPPSNAQVDLNQSSQRKRVSFAGPFDSSNDSVMEDANEEESHDGSSEDEFVVAADDLEAVDDETTMAQEEALPQEMTAQEELDLLQREANMSVEELMRMHYPADSDQDSDDASQPSEEASEASVSVSQLLSPVADDGGDQDEFRPDDANEVDDETTMEAEEQLGRDMTYEEELSLLKREGEMSIDELRALYTRGSDSSDENSTGSEAKENKSQSIENRSDEVIGSVSQLLNPMDPNGDLEDEEFQPEDNGMDDETTMEAEEYMPRDMSYEEEIALLKREGEMSLEEIRERYLNANADEGDEDSTSSDGASSETSTLNKEGASTELSTQEAALQALEASSERAQRTLASRPFLLAPWVKLREYQQIGLNWLVSIQSRRLNGILADEMGLGKTLQTIALFGYLAAYKGIWGPHLVVVPTSVLLNWETELKRFCPALKVLCYYGSAKHRKELRQGWTKSNCFHVVLTSYQLAVQDSFAFKRKKWYYMVLDEAQNIKNFQSQRWQTLINFNTQRRLLLTGTPLQNSLMELWSLLHFLMPYVFRSRKEFNYWFSNPMSGIVEGTRSHNDDVINRLHGIIRPFVLRRLKKDVESQLPGKYEHIVKCQLSRRQMFIYEEFMARSSTRQSLRKGGNFMDMMNVLMSLRKVCNHPDLFEPRPVITPFVMDRISLPVPSYVIGMLETPAEKHVSRSLTVPVWSGSCGLPSTQCALKHDSIEHELLKRFHERSLKHHPIPELSRNSKLAAAISHDLSLLWLEIEDKMRNEMKAKFEFLDALNSFRCRRAAFPYPTSVQELLEIPSLQSTRDVLSSPSRLLSLRRNQQERANDVDDLVKRFVFCVPKASTQRPILESIANSKDFYKNQEIEKALVEPLEHLTAPFREAEARLTSCFPDKKLVQFDAGKLQVLAELLRELKRGGHRALIFTQMTKMLDILEAFLNLHGHTYMRLDGSTSVDRRQRMMDRFNSDDKIFCFILSTRSGGLGINLTGADTVIFYDSDWNYAMDAQAQDRAHRIGQTREVHIYRLITQHTIEENILLKAQQKRHLDILVMDKGRFDSSQLFGHGENAKTAFGPTDTGNMYTAGGLRDILGANIDDEDSGPENPSSQPDAKDAVPSTEEIEKAMTTLEDEDDVIALQGARKEAADDLREFDESIEIRNRSGSDDEDDDDGEVKPSVPGERAVASKATSESFETENVKKSEEDLEKEFEAWQEKVGVDFDTITASLSPVEKYGLQFRQEIDPYYSTYAIMEYNQQLEEANTSLEEIDIAEIEREKAKEELQAFENGDLLGTFPRPCDLIRQRTLYQKEKARLKANKLRRKLTGEAWEVRKDVLSNSPFWYNNDTGEALWDRPKILEELEAYEFATEKYFEAMPKRPLRHIMEFLAPYPDRMNCALVSRRWHGAATCPSFVKHVYPVEQGAYTRDDSKVELNHFRTIGDALAAALPGDTIELGDGHYWINQEWLIIDVPVRIVGDEDDPSNVLVEVSGTVHWSAGHGYCEGVTFRRPPMASGAAADAAAAASRPLLQIEPRGRFDVICSIFDNGDESAPAVSATGRGMKGVWREVAIKHGSVGLRLDDGAAFGLISSVIKGQTSDGVVCDGRAKIVLTECKIHHVVGFAVRASQGSQAKLNRCVLRDLGSDTFVKEDDCVIEID